MVIIPITADQTVEGLSKTGVTTGLTGIVTTGLWTDGTVGSDTRIFTDIEKASLFKSPLVVTADIKSL